MAKSRILWPGEELIDEGLRDLQKGMISPSALLVLIGAPRLRRAGVSIPTLADEPESPEHSLYQVLREENPRTAHSRYNALIRRLISYERSLEQHHL